MRTKDELLREIETLKKRIVDLENTQSTKSLQSKLEQTSDPLNDSQKNTTNVYQFYQNIIEGVQDGVWVTDKNDVIIFINTAMENIAGVSKEEITGKNVLTDFPKETTKKFSKFYLEAKKSLKPVWYEVTIKTPAGRDTWQNGWIMPQTNNGRFDGITCTARDVTKQKAAEKALAESEHQYRTLLDNSGSAISYYDINGNAILLNKRAAQLLGGIPENFVGKTIYELYGQDLGKNIHERIKKASKTIDSLKYEDEVELPAGKKWFTSKLNRIQNKKGKTKGVQIVSIEITELKESEEKFRAIADYTYDWESWLDNTGKLLWVNSAVERISGYSVEECFKMKDYPFPLILEEDKYLVQIELDNAKKGYSGNDIRFNIKRKDNSIVKVAISYQPIKNGEGFRTSIRDISERVKIEIKIRDNEAKLRSYFENSPLGIFEIDSKGNFTNINPAAEKITGYTEAELLNMKTFDLTFDNKSKKEAKERFQKLIHSGKINDVIPFRKKNGEIGWWEINAVKLEENKFLGFTIDITDKHNAELALKESEEGFREMFGNMGNGVCRYKVIDEGGNYIFADINKAGERIAKVKKSDVIGKSIFEVRPNSGKFGLVDNFKKVWETGQPEVFNECFYQDAELTGYYRNFVYKLSSGDIVAIFEDLTKEKQADEALKKYQNTLVAALNSMTDAIFISDVDGNFIEFNDAFATFHKFKNKKKCAKTLEEYPVFLDVFFPDGKLAPLDMWAVPRALRGETGIGKEYILQRKDTGERWTGSYNFAPIRDEDDNITGSVVVARDITEIKIIEKQKLESQEKLRHLIEAASDAIYMTDKNAVIIETNNTACKMLNRTKKELIGQTIDVVDPNFPVKKFIEYWDSRPFDEQHIFETTHQKKDGSLIPIEISSVKYQLNGETFFNGIARDITERKKAENELKESEAKFKRFFNTNPSATFVWKAEEEDFVLIDVNEASQKMTSGNAVKFIGMKASTIYDDLPFMIEKLKLCWKTKKVIEFEHYYKNRNQNTFDWIEFRLAFAEPNMILLFSNIISDRKNAEKKLLETQYHLSKAQELGKMGTWELDIKKNELRWTDENYKIFGVPPDTPLNYEIFISCVHPEDRDFVNEEWTSKMNTNKYDIEHRLLVDGKIKWVREKAEIKFNDEGEPVNAVGFTQDITERKKAEKELKESESRFRSMFENHAAVMLLIEPETGKIIESNQAAADYYGYSRKKLNTLNINDINILPPEEVKKNRKLAESRHENTFYFKHRLKNKTIRDVQVHSTPIKYLNQRLLFSIIIDITEQKTAEEELIKAKIHAEEINKKLTESLIDLKLAQEIADIGNWNYNPTTDKQYWSDIVYSIHEKKPNEKLPNIDDYKKIYSPEHFEDFDAAIQSAIKNGKGYDLSYKLNLPSGKSKWVRTICQPDLKSKTEKGYFLRGTIQDITDRKNNEIALANALEQAKEADRLKSVFLANMSHEIRTPMNGILGFASLLKESETSKSENRKYVEIIEKSGKRMLSTINDLIDISRIEAGVTKVSKSIFNVNEQLEYLHTFFKPEAEKKNIDLILHLAISGREKEIFTDKEKFNAILINLIKNAIKYTEKGTIEFGYSVAHGKLEFFVKDTGIGIEKNRLEAVFERFVQEDLTITKPIEGAGLGLTISKGFALLLGGDIWVESVKGTGSTFYFSIDDTVVTKKKNDYFLSENDEVINRASEKLKTLNVLVAEDEEFSKLYFKKIFNEGCKSLIFVESGKECIKYVKNNSDIDLILMDIKIRQMDGYSATKEIRKFNQKVKIIAQTAYALTGEREKALKSGCDEYISKPIDKKQLFDIIDGLF